MEAMPRARPSATPDAGTAPCPHCLLDRRVVLKGVGAAGVAGLLAACGGDDESTTEATPGSDPTETEPEASAPDSSSPQQSTTPAQPAPEKTGTPSGQPALATTDEIPVGGGVILKAEGVVVTQPTAGQFAAFSTTCTHQGCTVTEVADGIISCPCHGSRFSAADGSVQRGPAAAPLPKVRITVQGDQILPQ